MNWIIISVYLLAMAVFSFFSILAIKHSARFRYLSARTVYLTIFYTSATSILAIIGLSAVIAIMVWPT